MVYILRFNLRGDFMDIVHCAMGHACQCDSSWFVSCRACLPPTALFPNSPPAAATACLRVPRLGCARRRASPLLLSGVLHLPIQPPFAARRPGATHPHGGRWWLGTEGTPFPPSPQPPWTFCADTLPRGLRAAALQFMAPFLAACHCLSTAAAAVPSAHVLRYLPPCPFPFQPTPFLPALLIPPGRNITVYVMPRISRIAYSPHNACTTQFADAYTLPTCGARSRVRCVPHTPYLPRHRFYKCYHPCHLLVCMTPSPTAWRQAERLSSLRLQLQRPPTPYMTFSSAVPDYYALPTGSRNAVAFSAFHLPFLLLLFRPHTCGLLPTAQAQHARGSSPFPCYIPYSPRTYCRPPAFSVVNAMNSMVHYLVAMWCCGTHLYW